MHEGPRDHRRQWLARTHSREALLVWARRSPRQCVEREAPMSLESLRAALEAIRDGAYDNAHDAKTCRQIASRAIAAHDAEVAQQVNEPAASLPSAREAVLC